MQRDMGRRKATDAPVPFSLVFRAETLQSCVPARRRRQRRHVVNIRLMGPKMRSARPEAQHCRRCRLPRSPQAPLGASARYCTTSRPPEATQRPAVAHCKMRAPVGSTARAAHAQSRSLDWYTNHWQWCHRSHHSGEMCGTTSACDNDFNPALVCAAGVRHHFVRRSVGADNINLERHAEALELFASGRHGRQIGVRSHYHPHERHFWASLGSQIEY